MKKQEKVTNFNRKDENIYKIKDMLCKIHKLEKEMISQGFLDILDDEYGEGLLWQHLQLNRPHPLFGVHNLQSISKHPTLQLAHSLVMIYRKLEYSKVFEELGHTIYKVEDNKYRFCISALISEEKLKNFHEQNKESLLPNDQCQILQNKTDPS